MKDNLKNQFPFRLGTTSYIIPAEILPNVRYLADKVDDIELVLFESDEILNIPDCRTVEQLRTMADENNLSYTVHLPLDAYLGSSEESIRKAAVEKCRRIIDRMEAVNPFSYVIHFHGDIRGHLPSTDMNRWLDRHRLSIEELLRFVEPRMLAVETLDYPYEWIAPLVFEYDLATCLDIGHILICGHPLEKYIEKYLPRTRVIHLHGVCDRKDHVDLSHIEPEILKMLMETFIKTTSHETRRVLTLEIFSEPDFCTSIEILRKFLP